MKPTPSARIDALGSVIRDAPTPSLRTINGFGNIVGGRFYDPAIAPLFFISCVPTLLFVPVSRGTLYVVAEGPSGVFRFYGSVFWEDFERLYPGESSKIGKRSAIEAVVAFACFVFAVVLVAVIFGGLPALFRGR